MNQQNNILQNLWLVGISHWNSPVDVLEKFSLSKQQIIRLIQGAKKKGITSILPVSTCNRVEIYAMAEKPEVIISLILELSQLANRDPRKLRELIYTKNSMDAVTHLFKVTTGLDSQILGDAQITGQIRDFLQTSLKQRAIDAVMNRMTETAINAGKKVKSATHLDSVSFSIAEQAVMLALSSAGASELRSMKYLVIGAGEMASLVVKSLAKAVPAENVTIANRTESKAILLSGLHGSKTADYNALQNEIANADFIFAATSSPAAIITKDLLSGVNLNAKTFIDLSLPRNIEPGLQAEVIDISQLSDSDKQKKEAYIRFAEELIEKGISDFRQWLSRFELAQSIKAELHDSIFQNSLDENGLNPQSKFVDGITKKYLRHFQKEKQSRNLAA